MHPRPFLQREWQSLDGVWEFGLGAEHMDREIVVPFAPETPASGIGVAAVPACRYRRVVHIEPPRPDERVLLHFGAVDRVTRVLVNGQPVGEHEGGYTAFSCDITAVLSDRFQDAEIRVSVLDDPADLEVPRGKQDWEPQPHSIWYPRTTGIWRTVWLERVATAALERVTWRSDSAAMTVTLQAELHSAPENGRLAVRITGGGRRLVDDVIPLTDRHVERTWSIGAAGDRDALAWSPDHPVLLDAELAVIGPSGETIDEAASYCALRTVDIEDGRLRINGEPWPLRLALDQGYWPDTGATPRDVDALREDIELTKALGLNGVRKHQKFEDPRYLALADQMGLLVWVEMPSAYRFSERSAGLLMREWAAIVGEARNHPSVIAWVPLNESWGVPDLETELRQRSLLEALTAIATELDGTRPVSANDGWETSGGQIVGIHDYGRNPEKLGQRYATRDAVDGALRGRRPDKRLADLDRRGVDGRAVVLSEFGGIALASQTGGDNWGYTTASSPEDLVERYRELWAAVHASDALAGACWTQLTDTYQEVNGLLTADRQPKAPVEQLANATRGR